MRGRCHNKKGKEEAGSRAAQAPKRRAHRLDSGAWVCVGGSPARPTETDWGPCVDGAISSPVVLHTAGKRQAGLVAQRQSPWVLCSLPMGRHAWHQGGPGCPCWRLAAYLSGAGLVLRRFACCSPAAHPQARPHIITHRHHHHPHNNTWRRLPTAICTCGLPICLRPAAAAAAATAAAAAASCVCRHCPSWWCRRVVTQ